jgi:hypothetical protein
LCSPVILLQIIYKLAFLSVAIAPLAAAGRWSAVLDANTAVFMAYLPLLLYCAPWGYLLSGEDSDTPAAAKKTM